MKIDEEIVVAVREAVRAAGQPDATAEKILAWLTGVISGNDPLEDREAVRRHLDVILASIEAPEFSNDEQ